MDSKKEENKNYLKQKQKFFDLVDNIKYLAFLSPFRLVNFLDYIFSFIFCQ